MGACISLVQALGPPAESKGYPSQECELQRLPCQVLVSIMSLLDQRDLLITVPQVCRSWQQLALQAIQTVHFNLSSEASQVQLPNMLMWLQQNKHQLHQLQLTSSRPLGLQSRRSLLRCLGSQSCKGLQLQKLALQLDLDYQDLAYLTYEICQHALQLHTLTLQPIKPSLADVQLLVLACILGNFVGADSPGHVLPQLTDCHAAVEELTSTATQLRSLSLSRFDLGSTWCIAAATHLTALRLQHCGLTDANLEGLANLMQLRKLELPDNFVTVVGLQSLAHLEMLTYLDFSVMPSLGRMRGSFAANIGAIGRLSSLQNLNMIGFGIADVTPLSALINLTSLAIGLNPLHGTSLRVIGQLPQLQRLELGGFTQAWVLASAAAPAAALREHDACWYGLVGLQQVTYLDLGGSNFNHAVWTCHMCPVLAGMSKLQQLHLAHCHIPVRGFSQLLPYVAGMQLRELVIDRCSMKHDEVTGLLQLPGLTRLSAAQLSPKLGDKQAIVLARLVSLRSLSMCGNDVGSKGAQALAKGLTKLTSLGLAENHRVSRRCHKQLAHLLRAADATAMVDLDDNNRYW